MSALTTMNQLNSNAMHGTENGREVFIEDHRDPDGRWYRLEYQCDWDGGNAAAWCRHNPWPSRPDDEYTKTHISPEDHMICVGPDAHRTHSGYDLEFVVRKARFWCTGYSYFRENGYEATCRAVPEWKWTGR